MTKAEFLQFVEDIGTAAGKVGASFNHQALRDVLAFEPTRHVFYDVLAFGANGEIPDRIMDRFDAALVELESDRMVRHGWHPGTASLFEAEVQEA